MHDITDLIAWASHLIAHGPDLGDGATAEGSAILSDIRKNRTRVTYEGQEHDVPTVTLQGNYIVTPVVDETGIHVLVLRVGEPVVPGATVPEAKCKTAVPVLNINIPNASSLEAILGWVNHLIVKATVERGPFLATAQVGKNDKGEVCVMWTKPANAPGPVAIVPKEEEPGYRHALPPVRWYEKGTELTAGQSPHDYVEDFGEENGHYLSNCCICGVRFEGHKRRVTCRVCTTSGAALVDAVLTGKTVQWANLVGLRSWFNATLDDIHAKVRTPALVWRIKDGA